MALTMARAQDGIPIVQSTTDRGTRFPSPADDQRVYNKGTRAVERYSIAAGGWISDLSYSAAPVGVNMVAIGTSALAAYPGPSQYGSVAVGTDALQLATTGDNNTAVGHFALSMMISGSNSTAVGLMALRFATAGNNTALGSFAATSTTTGTGNVALGCAALQANTTGIDNAVVGTNALGQSSAASNSVAIGSRAIYTPNAGHDNIAIGVESIYGNIQSVQGTTGFTDAPTITASWSLGTGWSNGTTKASKSSDGVGLLASNPGVYDYGVGATYAISYTIANLTSGSVTASFGGVTDPAGARSANGTYTFSALATSYPGGFVFTPSNGARFDITAATAQCTSAFTGVSNVAAGTGAAYMTTSGSSNVSIGQGAQRQVTSGSDNVAIGLGSLLQNGTGAQNVAIGKYAGYAATAASNRIHVGYLAGFYETAGSTLIVDAFDRINQANQRVQAIIYGVMNPTASAQTLNLNALVQATYGLVVPAGFDLTVAAGYGISSGTTRILDATATGFSTNASSAPGAGFNLPHGVAPTAPVNGDVWTTASGMFVRINGVTKSVNLT